MSEIITSGYDISENADDAEFSRTYSAAEAMRMRQARLFDEPDSESKYGYFADRPMIGHDTEINGGVYIGGGRREAIVVDDNSKNQNSNTAYEHVYQKMLERAKQRQATEGVNFKNGLLNDVYDTVLETLKFDDQFANDMADEYRDQKVNLSYFIEEGRGVCRHQALLTGYLLERLKKEGLVAGQVTVERNSIRGKGAHAWARYINSQGKTFVIDPTQGYLGALDDSPDEGWIYRRPEDNAE